MINALKKFNIKGFASKSEVPEELVVDLEGYHPAIELNLDKNRYKIESMIYADGAHPRGQYLKLVPIDNGEWQTAQKQFFEELKLRLVSEFQDHKLIADPIPETFNGWSLIIFELICINGKGQQSFEAVMSWRKGDLTSQSKWFWIPD